MDSVLNDLIDKCATSDNMSLDVAIVTHYLYNNNYKYNNNRWYVHSKDFNEWIETKTCIYDFHLLLSTEICLKFIDRAMYWEYEAIKTYDDLQRDAFEHCKQKLLAISIQLKNDRYKTSIINECKCLFN